MKKMSEQASEQESNGEGGGRRSYDWIMLHSHAHHYINTIVKKHEHLQLNNFKFF